MNVNERVDLGNGHFVEFGSATWNHAEQSVRDRYLTVNGGFSPRSSSEIPIEDVAHLAVETLNRDLLDVAATMRLLRAAVESIARRL